jgi:[acyl-carrier-protein] S-malonyltransferase
MGKSLIDNFSVARETFEEASEAIQLDLKRLCFEGPESDLKLTENTQPALVTVSIAAFRVAQAELGFAPTLAAGHSLGEYSALVAAGAIPFASAVAWVRARGRAMQAAVPEGQGGMSAVLGLENDQVRSACEAAMASARKTEPDAVVEPANFNAPGQVVIAGSKSALDLAAKEIQALKGKVMPLPVSAPFHCALMRPAREAMARIFSAVSPEARPKALRFPYLPNRTARITSEPGVVFDLLIDQIDHPVLWSQSMEAAIASGETQGLELGSGNVLCGLMKRISKASGKSFELQTLDERLGLK